MGDLVRMSNSKEHNITIEEIEKVLKRKKFSLFLIRLFDIMLSFLGIMFLLPLFAIVAIVVRCRDGKPIIFKQKRVGKNGKMFQILKYRTMVVEQKVGSSLITAEQDDRITKTGKILRKLKIDELPQLFNVLCGDMSFVGPRPDVKKHVDLYTDLDKMVLKIRPGITGLASLKYYNEGEILQKSLDPEKEYIERIMPDKNMINLQYMRKMGLFYNLGIILRTVFHRRKKKC